MFFTNVIVDSEIEAITTKSYSSREIFQMLRKDGWYEVEVVGDHHQFKPPTKPGKVTVIYPTKGYKRKTLMSIFKQAGIKPPK